MKDPAKGPRQTGDGAGTSRKAVALRRKLFVDAYLTNGHNATQAAIAAGFSARTANRAGTRLVVCASNGVAARSAIPAAILHNLTTVVPVRRDGRVRGKHAWCLPSAYPHLGPKSDYRVSH